MCKTNSNTTLDALNAKAMRIVGIASRLVNEADGRNDRSGVSNVEAAKGFAMEASQIIGRYQHPATQLASERRADLGQPLFFDPSPIARGEQTKPEEMLGSTTVVVQMLLDKAVALLPADAVATLNDGACPVKAAGRQCSGACKRRCGQ